MNQSLENKNEVNEAQLKDGVEIEIPKEGEKEAGSSEKKEAYKPSFVDKAKVKSGDTTSVTDNFRTENIGEWKAKQEGAFAEQNKRDAEIRQRRAEKRKKARPFVLIGGGVVLLGLIAWLVIAIVGWVTPEPENVTQIAGKTTEDIYKYQVALQEAFDRDDGGIVAVDQMVNNVLGTENGKENEVAVRLAKMGLLISVGMYQEVIDEGKLIDPEDLDNSLKATYYNDMYVGYLGLGETEIAEEYFEKRYEATAALQEEDFNAQEQDDD